MSCYVLDGPAWRRDACHVWYVVQSVVAAPVWSCGQPDLGAHVAFGCIMVRYSMLWCSYSLMFSLMLKYALLWSPLSLYDLRFGIYRQLLSAHLTVNTPRRRGRLALTWTELIQRDLKRAGVRTFLFDTESECLENTCPRLCDGLQLQPRTTGCR